MKKPYECEIKRLQKEYNEIHERMGYMRNTAPSRYYSDIIREGYVDNGIDPEPLYEVLERVRE